jgi:uncharacterized protein (DUF58 family)
MLAAGLLFYAAARMASIGEVYAVAFACFVFPIVSMAFVRWGRHSLEFERSIAPRRLFAGAPVRIEVSIRNLSRVQSPPLELDDAAPAQLGGPLRLAAPALGAHGDETLTIGRNALTRGRYSVGPLRARLLDPFGLAEVSKDVAPLVPLIVYPRVEPLHERTPPDRRGGAGRTIASRLAAEGDDFYAVREWQNGDDLRKIHWRSTARRDDLMIRQDEIRPMPRATVLIDSRADAHREAESFEWSVSATASVVWELARQGFALRLVTADAGPGGARWGREATDPLLAQLAFVQLSGAHSMLPSVRRAGRRPGAGGALFAIVPPPTQDMLLPLSRLARAYGWCGAVLLDTISFSQPSPRERALFDQRLAEADRSLTRAGWSVVIASASDKFANIWQSLLDSGVSRQSSPSLRS